MSLTRRLVGDEDMLLHTGGHDVANGSFAMV